MAALPGHVIGLGGLPAPRAAEVRARLAALGSMRRSPAGAISTHRPTGLTAATSSSTRCGGKRTAGTGAAEMRELGDPPTYGDHEMIS